MLTETQSRWLRHLLSAEPSDRPRAEAALSAWYPDILKLPAPKYFFWFDSPARAGWAVKLLESTRENLWQAFVEEKSSRQEGRLFLESLRSELCDKAGVGWDQLTQVAGRNRTQQTSFNLERIALHGLMDLFLKASRKDHPQHDERARRVHPLFAGPDKDSEMCRVENRFYAAMLAPSGWGFCLSHSMQSPYTFAKMAEDEEAVVSGGLEVPPAIAAAWDLARSAGLCWVFEGAVVLLDRPAELRFNSEMFLHGDDGPAGAFRDGTKIWAWNGMVSSEEFILHPEDIRPDRWKELPAAFVAHIKNRRAAAGMAEPSDAPGKAALKGGMGKAYTAILKAFGKQTGVFEKDLPAAIRDRLGVLREHNRGSLPLLDRYLAGEHEAVWRDLLALGAAVREDPHAADALAVAYETMSRVEANVRTVSGRLVRFGLTKNDGPLHAPPNRRVDAQIRRLEKVAGTLPVSLRAFYEIVGAVDWTGNHPHLSPARGPLCTDPFVVFPIEAALEFAGEEGKWILIAPDALHKANTSGGSPYQIKADLAADAVLQFEHRHLYFVEYLRLVFRFGGFPGYEGIEYPPPQLAELSRVTTCLSTQPNSQASLTSATSHREPRVGTQNRKSVLRSYGHMDA
jgi:hypothetical protein